MVTATAASHPLFAPYALFLLLGICFRGFSFDLPIEASRIGMKGVGVSTLGRGFGSGSTGRFSAFAEAAFLKLTLGVASNWRF